MSFFNHFVLTRFSYRDTPAHSGRVVSKVNASTVDPLAPRRLEKRFTLFELFCLPSILGQTTKDFVWILLIDPELKERYISRLQTLTAPHPRTHLVKVTSVDALGSLQWLRPYAEHPDAPYIATTNVDDDDLMGPGLLEYTQRHLRQQHDRNLVPPCQIIGVTKPPQWDFLPTRRARFGHVKPWKGRDYPSFTGFTLCVKQPEYDLSVLAFEHHLGGAYFDPAKDLQNGTQARLRSAAERAGDDWRQWSVERHLHVVQSVDPQVVLVNHIENDYLVRLLQNWSTRRPVAGAVDSPGMLPDFERIPAAIRASLRIGRAQPKEPSAGCSSHRLPAAMRPPVATSK